MCTARRGRRRERRLRRSVVPARGSRHPAGVCHRGNLVRLLRGQGGRCPRRRMGAGLRDVPVSERPTRIDPLVPRSHPRDDPAQRLRRPRGVLPGARRARGREGRARRPQRQRRGAAGTGAEAERQVPLEQDLLRDPDRRAGPLVQRRRLAVLPRLTRVLRRDRRRLHPRRRDSHRSGTPSSSATC